MSLMLVLGPVGFEPTTKGFTRPRSFPREWTISSPAQRHERVRVDAAGGCGMLQPVIKGTAALR